MLRDRNDLRLAVVGAINALDEGHGVLADRARDLEERKHNRALLESVAQGEAPAVQVGKSNFGRRFSGSKSRQRETPFLVCRSEPLILNQGGAAENPARQAREGKSGGGLKWEPAPASHARGLNTADVNGVVGD